MSVVFFVFFFASNQGSAVGASALLGWYMAGRTSLSRLLRKVSTDGGC
jgi:hypothetical protein